MLEKANEKLTNEMAANANHPYVQAIGQYLLNHLEAKPEHAENILAEDKTVLKSLEVMRRFAEQKRRFGNMAMLTDPEGYAIVLQYFGCWEGEPIEIPPEPERPVYQPPVQRAPRTDVQTKPTKVTQPKQTDVIQTSLFDLA